MTDDLDKSRDQAEKASLGIDTKREREVIDALGNVLPGHILSPYPSSDDLRRASAWARPGADLRGLDLNVNDQLKLLEKFGAFHAELPFPAERQPGCRYWYGNDFFGHGDAVVLYSMIRHLRPRRIVEVGSGFSSAVMLDTNERFLDSAIRCTFVDPDTSRLRRLLRPSDLEQVTLRDELVQDVPLSTFEQLDANDILFIDSSHVSKAGSDVNFLFFEVLPRLREGVHVHVHDVLYPFEHTPVSAGRVRNEAYLLRAFLMHNDEFRICFFNNYLKLFHFEAIARAIPTMLSHAGGSIWIRRARSRTAGTTATAGAVLDFAEEWRVADEVERLVDEALAPDAGVAVVAPFGSELAEFKGRKTWLFPSPGDRPDDAWWRPFRELESDLKEISSEGAQYLVVPESSGRWLAHRPRVREYLEHSYDVTIREDGVCVVYALRA